VTGQDNDFSLHGIDFLDNKTGWMIRDRYDSGSDCYRSQLLTTLDGGKSWQAVGDDGRQLDTVRFVSAEKGWAVSQDADETAKVPTGSPQPVRYSVLHTTDGGKNWSVQWKSGSGESESKPSLWAGDAQSAFALVRTRLLKTTDGGTTWTAVSFGIRDFTPVQMFFSDGKTGWVAGVNGKKNRLSILCTSNGGKSWSRRFQKNMDEGAAGCVGIDFLNAKEGWFLTSDLDTWNGELYHTEDGGLRWNKAGEIRCNRPTAAGLDFVDSRTGWIPLSVGAGPIDGGLSVTRDGGKTFRIAGENDTSGDGETRKITSAREIMFRDKTLGWAVGEDLNRGDCLLQTSDGGETWEQIYPGPEPTSYVSFRNADTGYGLGKLSDPNALLKTADGGQSWKTLYSFTGQYRAYGVSFTDEANGYVLAAPKPISDLPSLVVLHTADGGKTWSEKSRTNLENPSEMISYFGFFSPKDGLLIEGNSVSRTADGGKTWESVNSGQDAFIRQVELRGLSGDSTKWQKPAGGEDAHLYAASLLPGGTGFVLAGEEKQNGRMELLTTSDAGKTWSPHPFPEEINGEMFDPVLNPCILQFTDAAHGWILAAYGLLSTSDGGRSWAWQ
jgi:photosystem II stability/assembly factor-like uncharacterized protein